MTKGAGRGSNLVGQMLAFAASQGSQTRPVDFHRRRFGLARCLRNILDNVSHYHQHGTDKS